MLKKYYTIIKNNINDKLIYINCNNIIKNRK